jgi:UDP-2,4-diacetamido-2,4,6-trideoxy-beta-L-altropyranose hydrolase
MDRPDVDVVILTEGGESRGYGHFTRCSGLQDALLQAGHRVKLWVDCQEPLPAGVVSGAAYEAFAWSSNLDRVLTSDGPPAINSVVDSYLADRELLDAIASRSFACFFFDDVGGRGYPDGTVINAAMGAESLYRRHSQGTRYLVGPKYAVLRKEFWSPRAYVVRNRIEHVLVALGSGVDEEKAGSVAARITGCLPRVKVTVVHEAACSCSADDKVAGLKWVWDVLPHRFIDLALRSDLAICSGGQVLVELACLGVPAISIITADNQRASVSGFEDEGFAACAGALGDPACMSEIKAILGQYLAAEARFRRSAMGRQLVDGEGAMRVARAIGDALRPVQPPAEKDNE